jgi:transposase
MDTIHYIGFDVHKSSVSYCVKRADGGVVEEGRLEAERRSLRQWAEARRTPWRGALEATLFSGWIYDTLQPYAQQLEMAHPAMLKAIGAAKKKSDRIDARKIADLLRCDLLPTCYVAPPLIRELRRLLRYRNLVVRQAVRMQNKIAGLLMEVGAPYNREQLHGRKYFQHLMEHLEEVPESVQELLRLSRGALEMFQSVQKQLVRKLHSEASLRQRVQRLRTIPGVGEVTALSWALEIAEPQRFGSIAQVLSYCGLTSAFRSSADKQQRGPLSKQRNAHLQSTLIEAAKLAPRWNPQLEALHERERGRGHANRATLAVARKLAAYLLAVDKSGQAFQLRRQPAGQQQQAA